MGRKLAQVLGFVAVVLGAGALVYDLVRPDGLFNSTSLVVIAVGLVVIASARRPSAH